MQDQILESASGDKLEQLGPLLTSANYAKLGQGQAIALKQGRNGLQARVDSAIGELLADGTIAANSKVWFGYDLSLKRE